MRTTFSGISQGFHFSEPIHSFGHAVLRYGQLIIGLITMTALFFSYSNFLQRVLAGLLTGIDFNHPVIE